jgi:cellulose biosynthesis protein BcsQ
VEDKNTVSDHHDIEHERGSSVYSTVLHTEWRNYKINIIDTPGLDDLIGETIPALRVADTCVLLLGAHHGVEVGTDLVWDHMQRYDRPVIIGVNCSQPARRLRRAVSELAEWAAGQRGERPRVLAQPEVDEPAPDCKRPPPPETPERFAADLVQLLSEGADHLGGCCGCRPEHIAAVATRLAADRH